MKEEIQKQLLELADSDYKEFHSKLCPGIDNIIGVRVPKLRKYAKEISKKHDIGILLENIGNDYYEEIMLQGMLIGIANDDFEITNKRIKKFVPKIDNWAICDIFSSGLKITKSHKNEMWQLIQKYLESKKEFEIRFAIVMILDYYIEEEYLEKDFEIFDFICSKNYIKDYYYVKMAVAWAVSICIIKFYDETIKYLKKSKLDKFTYNKSLQKAIESYRINKEQKEYLKKLKR